MLTVTVKTNSRNQPINENGITTRVLVLLPSRTAASRTCQTATFQITAAPHQATVANPPVTRRPHDSTVGLLSASVFSPRGKARLVMTHPTSATASVITTFIASAGSLVMTTRRIASTAALPQMAVQNRFAAAPL